LLPAVRNGAGSPSVFGSAQPAGFAETERGSETMDLRIEIPKIRVLPPPDARLRSLAQGADQAEAWAAKARAKADPIVEKVYGVRRRLATGAVAILAVWLFVHVMFGANGMVVYRTKRTEYQDLQKEIGQLQKENDQYSEQVTQLKSDPKRIEKEAREQFHYARPGEVVYVSPEPAAPPQPSTNSASK
jgi:cell division protein FtsB